MTAVCVLNLVLLFYFKYFDFTVQTINDLFRANHWVRGIVLPIGISFFTFQGMSYSIDVYRGNVLVQKNPFRLALYIMLFPQLVAGPIVRYSDVELELAERKIDLNEVYEGLHRFIIGLSKKVLLANTFASLTDSIWQNAAVNADNTVATAWLGAIAYTLQIYFDFSGYSDMAIGMGRMLGFHFPENFNLPYLSKSITEFWRRWHISLSSWFRDYVYIPLGGNRKHVYFNLLFVFALTGLWHGAAWQFVVWGLWHGFFIVIERFAKKHVSGETFGWNWLRHLYTLEIVIIGWVFFRAPSIESAVTYIGTMFGIGVSTTPRYSVLWYLGRWNVTFLIIGVLLSLGVHKRIADRLGEWMKKDQHKSVVENTLMVGRSILLMGLFIWDLMRLMAGSYNPFIYFRF